MDTSCQRLFSLVPENGRYCILGTHTHTHKANSDLIVPWEQKLLPGDRMGDPRLRLTLFQSLIKAVFLGTQEQISELLLVFEIVIHGLVSP